MAKQWCISLSAYYLEYGRHVARLRRRHRRRRRRRRAYAPTSNTACRDYHEKINSWVSFSFLYEYGAPLLLLVMCRKEMFFVCVTLGGNSRFARCRHLTTTTRIPLVFYSLFNF